MKRLLGLLFGFLMVGLLSLGVVMPGPSRAQGENVLWKNHTLEYWTQALAVQGDVLWVGTAGGLLRWDLAQDTQTKYTPADGLLGMDIRDLALDSLGRIWVGHDRGLSVLSGSTWTNYHKDNSGIPGDVVLQVDIAGDGTVWLISRPVASDVGLGVTAYDGTTWQTYTEANSGLPDDQAETIGLDQNDHLWVTIRNGDVAVFDGVDWTVHPDPTYNHNTMSFIGPDNTGRMWFTSYYNYAPVLMFDGLFWHHITPEGGCDSGVRRGAFDGSGQLWLTTWAGLCRYDGTTWTRFHEGNSGVLNDVLETIATQGPNVWTGYGFSSAVTPVTITQFDGSAWTHHHKPMMLPQGFGYGLAVDHQGRLWFGLGSKGVAMLDAGEWTVYDDSNSGLPNTCTTVITVDLAGHVWFAGDGCAGGLVEYDGVHWTQHYGIDAVPDVVVRSVAVDQSGNVWAGSRQGLSVYDGTSWATYNTSNSGLPSNDVGSVLVDGAGHIWTGCMTRFDGLTWQTYASPEDAIETHYDDIVDTFHQNFACWIADNGRGKIWRENGISGVKAYDGVYWQTYSYADMGLVHLYSWRAWPQGLDQAGNLWVVAGDGIPRYGGVSRFDGTTWSGYRQADGLLEPPKWQMAADDDNHVWFVSGFGLSEFYDPWQPVQTTMTPASGGSLTSADGSTTVVFAAGTVTYDMVVTHTPMPPSPTGALVGIGRFFDLSATAIQITAPAIDFQKPYSLTVDYADGDLGPAVESTLGVYWWDGGQWVLEPSSDVDVAANRVTAMPDHMTLFAVLGETNRLYLPLVARTL
jgi:ligand-binding sensor domain-containing protein